MKKIAIIGAGLSGLVLADYLSAMAEVTVFDKFHQVSGRMATRVYPPYAFDHGAQFFTVKHAEFSNFIQPLILAGVVAHWPARFVEIDGHQVQKARTWDETFPHYVGVPNMAAVGQYLQAQLQQRQVAIRLNTLVACITRDDMQWRLSDAQGIDLGSYDWVVTAMPAEQSANLMPTSFAHHHVLSSIQMQPCYALMMGCEHSLNLAWDAAHVTNSILSWVSVNSTKPGRNALFGKGAHCSVVAMSRNQWAADHFNQPTDRVIANMLEAASQIIGQTVLQPKLLQLKKWHYANAQKLATAQVYLDATQQLAACGDWCISGRVESAFVSAHQLAQQLHLHL
ncbi:MAG TPA: NAD(P)-binding protein [Methylophilus sp.]